MTELAFFENVPVMPHAGIQAHVPQGGPIWPDFGAQHGARFCFRGRPVDLAPKWQKPERRFRRPAIWGGYLSHEFGHLVAEHITRVLPASLARPNDLFAFTLPQGQSPETLPDYLWQIFDWLAVPRASVRFVLRPSLAPELRVAPQGEMLGNLPPDPAYLDALDTLPERHGLALGQSVPLLYVSRAGWAAKGRGAHLGEAYLVGLLRQLGVPVIDPATLSIRAQMQAYAQAAVLVFAEGSALHGRQLLGRIDQEIHVLNRRPGGDLAHQPLAARCRRLVHHDVTAELLTVSGRVKTRIPKPREMRHLAASFYDIDALFAAFSGLGVALSRVWNMAAYRDAALSDALHWVLAHQAGAEQTLPNLIRIIEQTSALEDLPPTSVLPAARQALH